MAPASAGSWTLRVKLHACDGDSSSNCGQQLFPLFESLYHQNSCATSPNLTSSADRHWENNKLHRGQASHHHLQLAPKQPAHALCPGPAFSIASGSLLSAPILEHPTLRVPPAAHLAGLLYNRARGLSIFALFSVSFSGRSACPHSIPSVAELRSGKLYTRSLGSNRLTRSRDSVPRQQTANRHSMISNSISPNQPTLPLVTPCALF